VPVCGKCGKIKGFPQQTGIGSKFGGAEYWLNLWWLNVVAGLVSAEVVVSAELAVSCGSRLAAEAGIEGERTREQENGGARNLFAPLESNSDAV